MVVTLCQPEGRGVVVVTLTASLCAAAATVGVATVGAAAVALAI